MLVSRNPFNGNMVSEFQEDTDTKIAHKLSMSVKGYETWKHFSIETRAKYLVALANYLKKDVEKFAELASIEMGKPLQQGIAEIEKCIWVLEYFAQEATAMQQHQIITTEHKKSYVSFEPIGPVLAIMPWNFPYWQVFRVMAPILMAGNSMLLKHASNVTGCAIAIESAMQACGFPEHVFQLLKVSGLKMESIISHPNIQAITFTGSTNVGKKIAATAAQYIKKQVLELGGSDAYIICEDADLDLAVEKCAQSRLNNNGQSCIGAKRFIVHENIIESFTEKLKNIFESKTMGDPLGDYDLGPLASMHFRDELHEQVIKSQQMGAQIITGGFKPKHNGALYPPTILANVQKGMPAYEEELFGPVAAVIAFNQIEEAIRIANDTVYGLGGGIFSRNEEMATIIAEQYLQAGNVAINNCVSSDPRLPFGGIKQSGYGRELSSYGFKEFCNIKTITIH